MRWPTHKGNCLYFSLILAWLMLGARMVAAHPHVFLEVSLTVHFDEQGLSGLQEEWVFDEMFSAMIIEDYDANKDGMFTGDEIVRLENEVFENLKEFDYFTYIRIDEKPFVTRYVVDFKPGIRKDQLVFGFFVPCHVTAIAAAKKIRISIFDKSYYAAVGMIQEKPVLAGKAGDFHVEASMYRNEKFMFMEQDGFPETMTIQMRK